MVDRPVHVAVGVIEHANGDILISQRAAHLHQGGCWEFPGGKVEADESALEALKRELQEELNLQVEDAKPLLQVSFDYPEKSVLLDVWHVTKFLGTVYANEGQIWRWVPLHELADYQFPPANTPILAAILKRKPANQQRP